jgi:hypothetical protein
MHVPHALLVALNIGFFVFHTSLITFNVIGWAWKRTRLYNLCCLFLTAASWLLMGIWHGVGYCICTDLHFKVRQALGIHDGADNYLQLLARNVLGIDPPSSLVRQVAGLVFGLCVMASIALNYRDRAEAIALAAERRSA